MIRTRKKSGKREGWAPVPGSDYHWISDRGRMGSVADWGGGKGKNVNIPTVRLDSRGVAVRTPPLKRLMTAHTEKIPNGRPTTRYTIAAAGGGVISRSVAAYMWQGFVGKIPKGYIANLIDMDAPPRLENICLVTHSTQTGRHGASLVEDPATGESWKSYREYADARGGTENGLGTAVRLRMKRRGKRKGWVTYRGRDLRITLNPGRQVLDKSKMKVV